MKYYNLPRFIIILRWALSTEVQPWRTMCLQQPQGEDEQVQVLSLLKEWVWLSENTSEHPHKSTWNPHDIYIYIYIGGYMYMIYIFIKSRWADNETRPSAPFVEVPERVPWNPRAANVCHTTSRRRTGEDRRTGEVEVPSSSPKAIEKTWGNP